MNIGPYTFQEFKQRAADFHGYPAPGLLIGGYMVALAKSRIPEGALFEALVESQKCLPDAVQMLTLCSTGNGWMKVVNLGRYAVTLYDKFTGEGVRVALDPAKVGMWPEIKGWYLKLKPKKEQDTDRLFDEIERAGPSICTVEEVLVPERARRKAHMGDIAVCPICGEAYPARDGGACRGCQGEAPYLRRGESESAPSEGPRLRAVPVDQALGRKALHDMTRIVPGRAKDPLVQAGQALEAGDLCELQRMGRFEVYLESEAPEDGHWVHENEAALAFAKAVTGPGVLHDPEPREGKINFTAARSGLLVLDRERLLAFNMVQGVMCATRQGDILVEEGKRLAACRAIPLYLARDRFEQALSALDGGPLLSVLPLRRARVGVLVTGTEVFQGLIEDRFAPIVKSKVEALGSEVVSVDIVPDDRARIADSVRQMLAAGADLVITTAGLSVDPGDVTRHGLIDAGLTDFLYGAPILPGAMTLVGRIGQAQVLGVPACALFYKTTSLDLILPRLLAGQALTRRDLALMAEGGFCLGCKSCTFPKCPFGK
ncbi:FmdE family protein [Desulfovibrio aminophilus]|nr:FmdE family protein [Desulfovibrio aminophilus]MCM0753761.1 FmdE family protein [Desulfovibrio aminophilus]